MSKKHPQFRPFEGTVGGRRFYAFFGVLAVLGGVLTIGLGRLYYQNYRGDNVRPIRDSHRSASPFDLFSESAAPQTKLRHYLGGLLR